MDYFCLRELDHNSVYSLCQCLVLCNHYLVCVQKVFISDNYTLVRRVFLLGSVTTTVHSYMILINNLPINNLDDCEKGLIARPMHKLHKW